MDTYRTDPPGGLDRVPRRSVVSVVFLAAIWGFLIPLLGFDLTLLCVVLVFAGDVPLVLFFWNLFRPTGVRFSNEGAEVQRFFGPSVHIARADVSLQPRNPPGFGWLGLSNGSGVILSPNQFAAGRTFYPVGEGGPAFPSPPPK